MPSCRRGTQHHNEGHDDVNAGAARTYRTDCAAPTAADAPCRSGASRRRSRSRTAACHTVLRRNGAGKARIRCSGRSMSCFAAATARLIVPAIQLSGFRPLQPSPDGHGWPRYSGHLDLIELGDQGLLLACRTSTHVGQVPVSDRAEARRIHTVRKALPRTVSHRCGSFQPEVEDKTTEPPGARRASRSSRSPEGRAAQG